MAAPGVAKGKVCVSAVADLDQGKLPNWSESSVGTSEWSRPRCSEHFWKMRSAKCAQDSSENSISENKRAKIRPCLGAALDL